MKKRLQRTESPAFFTNNLTDFSVNLSGSISPENISLESGAEIEFLFTNASLNNLIIRINEADVPSLDLIFSSNHVIKTLDCEWNMEVADEPSVHIFYYSDFTVEFTLNYPTHGGIAIVGTVSTRSHG